MGTLKRRDFFGVAGAALALSLCSPADVLAARRSEHPGEDVQREDSKEFQLKLDVARMDASGISAADAWLRAAACRALDQCGASSVRNGKADAFRSGPPVVREAIRYDTSGKSADGLFRKQGLSLALEATDERTKLKCKHHSFIPELVCAEPRDSVCYPGTPGAGQTKARFKVEQDIHFNNTKTCASGSVFLAGRRTEAADVSFFSTHFPRLSSVCPPETPLHVVHHWRETVYESRELRIGRTRLSNVMLVNRWDTAGNALVESELSYKVRKEMGHSWDSEQLNVAARLYAALHATGAFQADPPIFYFMDPVASVDIRKA